MGLLNSNTVAVEAVTTVNFSQYCYTADLYIDIFNSMSADIIASTEGWLVSVR